MKCSANLCRFISARQFSWPDVPAHYSEWLQHPHSLTQRLRELSQHKLKQHLVSEAWKMGDSLECTPLAQARGERMWVREIRFDSAGQAWLWAKTLIPEGSIVTEGFDFSRVGNQSIGDILFKDPGLKRSEFEIAQLNAEHPYYVSACADLKTWPTFLWARRSVLYFHTKPLLVYELFLPALWERILCGDFV